MALKYLKNNEYPNGFTLAEVLITLVIIGIIAAMTVPAVINSYVESSTVSKVKKGLSILGQAKILAEAQNGPVTDWDFEPVLNYTNAQKFWKYLKPHIQVAKDCGSSTACYQADDMYLLSGNSHDVNHSTSVNYYKFVLSDGSVMWLRMIAGTKCGVKNGSVENACAIVYYDVNGDKKPNTVGRDIFEYNISADGVFPQGINDCRKTGNGWGCSAIVIKTGSMKYLH